jgi:hypothetical protein
MPATKQITLMNLQMLSRGRKYKRTLTMSIAGAYGQPSTIQKFPITFGTMSFFRGLRGIFWRWGLRGGLVGLAWNFAAGWVLAFLLYLLIPALVPTAYLSQASYDGSFGAFMRYLLVGIAALLRPLGPGYVLADKFPLIVGAITGLVGFSVGYGKGHTNYTEKQGASTFRVWTFWLSLAFAIVLLVLDQGGYALGQLLQGAGAYAFPKAILLAGGAIMIGILTFIIAAIVAAVRYWLEKHLRDRYKELLNPPGRA